MNEQNDAGPTPPPIIPGTCEGVPSIPPLRPFSYWAKRFLACNPFYLVSAALLLYGLYRVSVDPNFLTKETTQLAFNFTSLQLYEMLLVLTAIFLARRRIWYDSTLLVGLENLLIFVPFMLISQAALIDQRAVWIWCLLGGVVAVLRTGLVKRLIRPLNLPKQSLWIGLVFLVVNVALPVIYRILHESKFGTKPDWGAAYHMNIYAWVLILPAAFALANFLPHARETGSLLPQRRWLPAGLFALWAVATGVHLYALGYIYDFDPRREWIVPTVWVIAWTAYRRAADIFALPENRVKATFIFPPALIALFAVSSKGTEVFVALAALNAVFYGIVLALNRANQILRHLLFVSVVMVVAGLPENWVPGISPDLVRSDYVFAAIAIYVILCAALSRNPRLGILGGITSALAMGSLLDGQAYAFHWALQSGLVFALLHSLRWNDSEQSGATVVRILAGVFWITHSFGWMHGGGEPWMTCLASAVVFGSYLGARLFRGRWDQPLLPAAALLVMLSGPGDAFLGTLQSMSSGLLAVIGSFGLFALGTAAALTKHLWHDSNPTTSGE